MHVLCSLFVAAGLCPFPEALHCARAHLRCTTAPSWRTSRRAFSTGPGTHRYRSRAFALFAPSFSPSFPPMIPRNCTFEPASVWLLRCVEAGASSGGARDALFSTVSVPTVPLSARSFCFRLQRSGHAQHGGHGAAPDGLLRGAVAPAGGAGRGRRGQELRVGLRGRILWRRGWLPSDTKEEGSVTVRCCMWHLIFLSCCDTQLPRWGGGVLLSFWLEIDVANEGGLT